MTARDIDPQTYLPLLHKIAKRFTLPLGLDRDDLVQQGCLEAIRAIPEYDPSRAALSTFLYSRCWGVMATYLRSHNRKYGREESLHDVACKNI